VAQGSPKKEAYPIDRLFSLVGIDKRIDMLYNSF
jgi:hypothetical protein